MSTDVHIYTDGAAKETQERWVWCCYGEREEVKRIKRVL
jgi:hypothetical protein